MCQARVRPSERSGRSTTRGEVSSRPEDYGINANSCFYRYANMDYILFSGLKNSNVGHIRISYDIMCQWCKRLPDRRKTFPANIRLPDDTHISFGIPKFHLEGHGPSCRTKFSFNFLVGSGRTCGESVETEWAVINIVAASTREMAFAARQETLNDHWSYWNWCKTTGFG